MIVKQADGGAAGSRAGAAKLRYMLAQTKFDRAAGRQDAVWRL